MTGSVETAAGQRRVGGGIEQLEIMFDKKNVANFRNGEIDGKGRRAFSDKNLRKRKFLFGKRIDELRVDLVKGLNADAVFSRKLVDVLRQREVRPRREAAIEVVILFEVNLPNRRVHFREQFFYVVHFSSSLKRGVSSEPEPLEFLASETALDASRRLQVNIFAFGKRLLPAVAVNASQLRRPKATKPETGKLVLANAFDENVCNENHSRGFGDWFFAKFGGKFVY